MTLCDSTPLVSVSSRRRAELQLRIPSMANSSRSTAFAEPAYGGAFDAIFFREPAPRRIETDRRRRSSSDRPPQMTRGAFSFDRWRPEARRACAYEGPHGANALAHSLNSLTTRLNCSIAHCQRSRTTVRSRAGRIQRQAALSPAAAG